MSPVPVLVNVTGKGRSAKCKRACVRVCVVLVYTRITRLKFLTC